MIIDTMNIVAYEYIFDIKNIISDSYFSILII
jgi:hypothetical protein